MAEAMSAAIGAAIGATIDAAMSECALAAAGEDWVMGIPRSSDRI
jgi:hypothetical protein